MLNKIKHVAEIAVTLHGLLCSNLMKIVISNFAFTVTCVALALQV